MEIQEKLNIAKKNEAKWNGVETIKFSSEIIMP